MQEASRFLFWFNRQIRSTGACEPKSRLFLEIVNFSQNGIILSKVYTHLLSSLQHLFYAVSKPVSKIIIHPDIESCN